jgi:penicillin amidase
MSQTETVRPILARTLGLLLLCIAVIAGLASRPAGIPPLGTLLDPAEGVWRTARLAIPEGVDERSIVALDDSVLVVRDERGVPHIFARTDRDAIVALGYVVAQDRLFQLDFIPRAASGRLSEVFGPGAVPTDRFLRSIGMDWGARRNAARIREEDGVEAEIIAAFGSGVNAYLDGMREEDLPFEFRLLGYQPERYTVLHATRLLQYMNYDLAFRRDALDYARLRQRLGEAAYRTLYPQHPAFAVPVIPSTGDTTTAADLMGTPDLRDGEYRTANVNRDLFRTPLLAVAQGFRDGMGSNNWAVHGTRATKGAPILAGDMHLAVSLPAIWYEAHLVTPSMNAYGVTIPGAPVLVEAFNDHLGWTFTNTGGDVLDHYSLTPNPDSTAYRYEGTWRRFDVVVDTIQVRGARPMVDTLRYSHWGPVVPTDTGLVALQWTAHAPSRTLRALWDMGRASSYDAFEDALRRWDTPMQNILYAGSDSTIAIRSTGYMPLRVGGSGEGLLDGSSGTGVWSGRVPFEELPHAVNPEQGFLTSTNQVPTGPDYPHYFGHDWRSVFRSMRIDSLLRGRERHSLADVKRYQSDVVAMQHALILPLLDTLSSLSLRPDSLRRLLTRWDGRTTVDRPEPLILDIFLDRLADLTWDESAFEGLKQPAKSILFHLLYTAPASRWMDITTTPEREGASELLQQALTQTADSLETRYGWAPSAWRWGNHHTIVFRHLTRARALEPLWRGPVEYPGFAATLAPAAGRQTTHSASWRMVVDFSVSPPRGYGIYPGGQSGNPFSPYYDLHLPAYVGFELYDLHRPRRPSDLDQAQVLSSLTLLPETDQ